jgi:hypothetical protein
LNARAKPTKNNPERGEFEQLIFNCRTTEFEEILTTGTKILQYICFTLLTKKQYYVQQLSGISRK